MAFQKTGKENAKGSEMPSDGKFSNFITRPNQKVNSLKSL